MEITEEMILESAEAKLEIIKHRVNMSHEELITSTIQNIIATGERCGSESQVSRVEIPKVLHTKLFNDRFGNDFTVYAYAHPDHANSFIITLEGTSSIANPRDSVIQSFSEIIGVAHNHNIVFIKPGSASVTGKGSVAMLLSGCDPISYVLIERLYCSPSTTDNVDVVNPINDYETYNKIVSISYVINSVVVNFNNYSSDNMIKTNYDIKSNYVGVIPALMVYNKSASAMTPSGGRSCSVQFKNPKNNTDKINSISKVYKDLITDVVYGIEIVDQELHIIICSFGDGTSTMQFHGVMKSIIEQVSLSDKPLDEVYAMLGDKYKHAFDRFSAVSEYSLRYGIQGGLEQRRNEYNVLYKDIERLITELSYLKTRTNQINREIELLSKGEHGVNFGAKIDLVKRNPKIKMVTFTLDGNPIDDDFDPLKASGKVEINIFTNNIYIHHQDEWYDIGTFHISLQMTPDSSKGTLRYKLKIFNTKHTIDAFWGESQHPHVNSEGNPCQGDAVTSITDALASYDFAAVVLICVNYVSSFNPNDPAGRSITAWPTVPESVVYDNSAADVSIIDTERFMAARKSESNALQNAFANRMG